MLTACGRKNLSYRNRILAFYPIKLERTAVKRFIVLAILSERYGAFLRIQLIFDAY